MRVGLEGFVRYLVVADCLVLIIASSLIVRGDDQIRGCWKGIPFRGRMITEAIGVLVVELNHQ